MSSISVLVMICEGFPMNIASSFILEYELSILKLLVEDTSEGYTLLEGMSFLRCRGIISNFSPLSGMRFAPQRIVG